MILAFSNYDIVSTVVVFLAAWLVVSLLTGLLVGRAINLMGGDGK